jgi:hypothetical protein
LPGHPVAGCVNGKANRTVSQVYTSKVPACPKGSFSFSAASEGQLGTVNTQVQQNASAIAGLQGVGKSAVADLAPGSIATGGSFVAKATQVGTLTLKAGTYLLSLNAKATPPSGGTGTAQVFPEFFVYNQAANAAFTGDLLNLGSGALESGSFATIDSYYTGTGVITLPATTTLHVYAFGYDSDTGAGSYQLDAGSIVTAVALAS